jgi:hypothetical protein
MSAWIIVLIVVIVALLAIIAGLMAAMSNRRKKLQERFGPEYDRLVEQSQSRRLAEAELTERERRVKKLELVELSEPARQRYLAEWAGVQERFVDDPAAAIAEGQRLVETVLRERGYPAAEYHQTLADLSVEHAQQLDHVRQAHEISEKAAAGQASTEELRIAMLHYRELFGDLLGDREVTTAQAAATASEEPVMTPPAATGAMASDPVPVQNDVGASPAYDDEALDEDEGLDEDAEADDLRSGTARGGRR